MDQDGLAALRAKRMQELQQQYGVRFFIAFNSL